MKKRPIFFTAVIMVLILSFILTSGIDVIALDPEQPDVIEFNQQNTAVSQYLAEVTYSPDDYSYSRIADYVTETDYDKSEPFGVTVNVPQKGLMTLTDGDHQMSYKVKAGDNTIYNLTPGRISTYRVVDEDDGSLICEGQVRPTGALRMLNTTGTKNVRDLGGWACDGGTVKYGKLFRGGEVRLWDVALFHDLLGIRAELNMRWSDEVEQGDSLIGSDVDFEHISGPWYTIYSSVNWSHDAFYQMLNYVMDKAIEDTPVYFHCAAGADRTGTLAFILESMLGVSQSDTDKDYELTCFETGVGTDKDARRRDEDDWKNYMAMFEGYNGDTMRDKVISWALSIGISMEKINAFRQAMIDGNPELLSIDGRETLLLGDADGSADVSILDATIIRRYCAFQLEGINMDDLIYGDVDGNGAVEITDATYIQRWLVLMNVMYPIGYPIEQEEPTEPPTEPPTEEPTEPPTEPPTDAPTEPPTDAPTEAPTEPPTQAPTEPDDDEYEIIIPR